jgi:predicted acylesterase/phospholipase RssA
MTNLKIDFSFIPNIECKEKIHNSFFIEGGGTKGIFALGVLKYLFSNSNIINLNEVDIFGGTSVGSYFSIALALGCQQEDLDKFIQNLTLENLVDHDYLFLKILTRFLCYGYLYDNEELIKIITSIIDLRIEEIQKDLGEKITSQELTINHLKKLIQLKPHVYKNLVINSVDLSHNKQVFFTTLNNQADNIKLLDIALASSALPFIFKPVILHFHHDMYVYPSNNKEDVEVCHLIDGALAMNNPLDYFLLNNFTNHKLWLLRFTKEPSYVSVKGIIQTFKIITDYLIVGRDNIEMELLQKKYCINIINLQLQEGILELYNHQQIEKWINDTYEECRNGSIRFVTENA